MCWRGNGRRASVASPVGWRQQDCRYFGSAVPSPIQVSSKLSAPVVGLTAELQERFRAQLTSPPDDTEVLHLRALAGPMAELQQRHRTHGHHLSAGMVEALGAALELEAGIAVSRDDIDPSLRAAASEDGIDFHVL
jgi:hypothetical protein